PPSEAEPRIRHRVVDLRHVGTQSERALEEGNRLGRSSPFEEQRAEVVVRAPFRRVLAHRVAPEGLEVREDMRPAPGGGPEGEEEPGAREARRTEGGELPCPSGPERDEERDRAEAREILEVIRDEGVAERVDIDEAERGRECDREVEDRRKRPSPDPIPEPPC